MANLQLDLALKGLRFFNTAESAWQRACVDSKASEIAQLFEQRQLDPVRTEIYAESPIVLEFQKSEHIRLTYDGHLLLIGLADGAHIITVDSKNQYALYAMKSENAVSFRSCRRI